MHCGYSSQRIMGVSILYTSWAPTSEALFIGIHKELWVIMNILCICIAVNVYCMMGITRPIIMTCILNGVLSGFCQSDSVRLGCIPSISSSGHNMFQGFPPGRAFYNLCLSAPWLGCWSFQSTV